MGINKTSLLQGDSNKNPRDYVLIFEGLILFVIIPVEQAFCNYFIWLSIGEVLHFFAVLPQNVRKSTGVIYRMFDESSDLIKIVSPCRPVYKAVSGKCAKVHKLRN